MSENATKLSAEQVQELLSLKPELRDDMLGAVDERIKQLQDVRAAITGGSRRRRSKNENIPEATDGRTHGDAILHVLGLKAFENGGTSKEIRAKLEEIGHPMATATFHTTMSNLYKSKDVKKKGKKGSKVYSLAAA